MFYDIFLGILQTFFMNDWLDDFKDQAGLKEIQQSLVAEGLHIRDKLGRFDELQSFLKQMGDDPVLWQDDDLKELKALAPVTSLYLESIKHLAISRDPLDSRIKELKSEANEIGEQYLGGGFGAFENFLKTKVDNGESDSEES